MNATTTLTEIDYPSSDGQPMAETPLHVDTMMLLHQALEDFFGDRPDVFIATDIFCYSKELDEKGNEQVVCVAPDALVAIGVPEQPRYDRRSYFTWRENDVIPSVVFEVASKGTWHDDVGSKYRHYQKLGVPEYFMYDPEGEYLHPALQGFRLESGTYQPILPSTASEDDEVELESNLGFRLRGEGVMLRLIEVDSGQPILSRAEQVEQQRERTEDERRQKEDERRQKEDERRQKEDERRQKDQERLRADQLASEVERLKARLAQLGQPTENGS